MGRCRLARSLTGPVHRTHPYLCGLRLLWLTANPLSAEWASADVRCLAGVVELPSPGHPTAKSCLARWEPQAFRPRMKFAV